MGAIDHTSEAIDVWAAELRMQFGGQSIAPAAWPSHTESRQAPKAPPFSDGEVRKAAARAEVRLDCLSIAAHPRFCTESRRALTCSGCGHRTPPRRRLAVFRRLDRTLENAQVLADFLRSLCAVDAERELEIFSERASAPVQAMPVEASSDR